MTFQEWLQRYRRIAPDDNVSLEAVASCAWKDAAQDRDNAFKNFHRLLCERFSYHHDERDWKRDQLSLIEHIAKQTECIVTCCGCGLMQSQEPSVARRPDGNFRCNDCERSRQATQGLMNSVSPWDAPRTDQPKQTKETRMPAFDYTKPFQTRDGRKAEFVRVLKLAQRQCNAYPLAVIVTEPSGEEIVEFYNLNGRYSNDYERGWDLVNTPEVRVVYVNYYGDGQSAWAHDSPTDYDFPAAEGQRPVACIKLTYTDGKVTAAELVQDDA